MDIAYNKTDGVVLPITNTRISASEYNQIAGSLMQIITSAGLTPDGGDNTQLLNAVKSFIGRTVIETYSNGTSWYRVYSDGWCEQGGMVPYESGINTQAVTFLKPYRALPYVLATATTTNSSFVDSTVSIFNLTTTGFTKQYVKSVGLGWTWMARGYLAS